MIYSLYDIPIKNKKQTYKAITELFNHDNYTTGNSLTYEYFCNHYKLIAIDLSKQNSEFKNQQINFAGKLEQNATIFFITEELATTGIKFEQNTLTIVKKMESQKIKNLLNHKDETYKKYQTKKWYIINDRNDGHYDKSIKIDTEVVTLFLCDYSDAYILVTGNITVAGGNGNTKAAFKNCHPFTKSDIHLNDEHVDKSDNLDIIMNMYNLIEYSDNYSDSTASLYQFKKQKPPPNNNNITVVASSSFKV